MNSSLNNIILTNDLLVGLYKNYLVEDSTKKKSAPTKNKEKKIAEKKLNYLGGNEKKVLILLKSKEPLTENADVLSFLKKILKPCHLTLNDVAIINFQLAEEKKFQQIIENTHPQNILLFDTTPTEINLPIDFPQFQVQQYLQMKLLYLPSLEEIKNNVDYKKDTWNNLKKIFSL